MLLKMSFGPQRCILHDASTFTNKCRLLLSEPRMYVHGCCVLKRVREEQSELYMLLRWTNLLTHVSLCIPVPEHHRVPDLQTDVHRGKSSR